jgi:sterol desaturase/sphingolipid hydroxylase (fatty acid hydroxylase superfamily)
MPPMSTPFHLPFWLSVSPLLPWTAAILVLALIEHFVGSPVRWAHRRDNLVAGGKVLLSILLTQLTLGVVLALVRHATHTPQAPIALDQGYPGAAVIGGLAWVVLYDAGYYGFHRLQHTWAWLWQFHAVHHSDPDMNATTYVRQHVLEVVFQSTFLLFPMLLLFRLSPATAFIVGLVSGLFQFWIHADVPVHYGRLSTFLASPLQHRWHHARDVQVGQVNFAGVFPWLDALFCTYKAPVKGARIPTGLHNTSENQPVVEMPSDAVLSRLTPITENPVTVNVGKARPDESLGGHIRLL